MKIEIDTKLKTVIIKNNEHKKELKLYSKEFFEFLSKIWLKIGWNEKYSYSFTWFGRPIIQLPDDILRIQEIIMQMQPDIIIETGIAHGGSIIFYASLCKLLNKGRVIGVDIKIRPKNLKAIREHPLNSYITLIEGNSVDPNVIKKIEKLIKTKRTILIILDSNHSKEHVFNELLNYSKFVSLNSYIVVNDGIMKELYDVPNGHITWKKDNPFSAIKKFLLINKNFIIDKPKWLFNESRLKNQITYWPNAWLKRIK